VILALVGQRQMLKRFMRLYIRLGAIAAVAVFAFVFVGGLAGHSLIIGLLAAAAVSGLLVWAFVRADRAPGEIDA
jgi:hypothetical protein